MTWTLVSLRNFLSNQKRTSTNSHCQMNKFKCIWSDLYSLLKIDELPSLTYILGPIPFHLFKNFAQAVFPFLSWTTNFTLSNRWLLEASKHAAISPILKGKPLLWQCNPNSPFLVQSDFLEIVFMLTVFTSFFSFSFILTNKVFIHHFTETTFVNVTADLHAATFNDLFEVINLLNSHQYSKWTVLSFFKSFLAHIVLDRYYSSLPLPFHLHGFNSESDPQF